MSQLEDGLLVLMGVAVLGAIGGLSHIMLARNPTSAAPFLFAAFSIVVFSACGIVMIGSLYFEMRGHKWAF